ncbi:MAG: BatA and WFA domain-containing protein [Verrucomicrobia bacterium]|nr:BatA and WFA domain-containing protein [Verrucomicrobiota bacterium]
MSFLAPLFLLGGLAVALPVVFHLVRRSSREKQMFSSLMFLKPTPPRMTRRNRLENIFLLLLRCLAICILALGFARPFFQKPMAATPANTTGAQIVLLIDTSASMKRDGVWAEALIKANAALEQTTTADQVAILTFDDQVRTVISFEQWAAINFSDRTALANQRLAESKPTWHATHLSNALIAAAEVIEDAEKREQHTGPRRIILITDMQDGSRLDGLQGYEWPRGLEVVVEPAKSKRPTNAGLQWVLDAEDSASVAAESPVRIRVSNSADAEREQFRIRWVGVAEAASLDAYVPPGQSRIVPAPKVPTNAVATRITLSGDDDDFDNTVYVVSPKAEDVNVLYLGSELETDSAQSLYYLTRAFQDTRRQAVRLERRTPNRLDDTIAPETSRSGDRRSDGSRLAIITSTLSEERSNEMRQYLTNGGTALLVINDPQITQTLGHLTGNPAVSANEASVGNYAMFGAMDFTHPLLAPFSDPRFGDFTKIRFWKHRQLSPDQLPGARVIASYDNNDPAILEVPVGRGRIFVFTFSWRPADSQFALSSKFVPMLYSLLDQAGGLTSQLAQFRVGDAVELGALTVQNNAANLSVRKPDGAQVQLASGETRFTQTDQPGVYEVQGIATPTTFAVNLDAAESRTAPLPSDELERLGVPMKSDVVTPAFQAAQLQTQHNTELEARQKLWRWLIVAALAVLLVETWLAGWITRRSAAPVEATA